MIGKVIVFGFGALSGKREMVDDVLRKVRLIIEKVS